MDVDMILSGRDNVVLEHNYKSSEPMKGQAF